MGHGCAAAVAGLISSTRPCKPPPVVLETRANRSVYGITAVTRPTAERLAGAAARRGRALADSAGTEKTMEEYVELKRLVDEIADDVYKAAGGNKAAGTRVRKVMQDVKNAAQEVRKRILEQRSTEDVPSQPPA